MKGYIYVGLGIMILSIGIFLIFQFTTEQKNSMNFVIRTQNTNESNNYFNETIISTAVNLAKNSNQFQSVVKGNDYTLDSVFGELDNKTKKQLVSYGVAFSFNNENPCSKYGLTMDLDEPDVNPGVGTLIQREVVVFENANLTNVLGVGDYRSSCSTGFSPSSCFNQSNSNYLECGGLYLNHQSIVLPNKTWKR